MTLRDFWNSVEVQSVFVVSTAIPAGKEYTVGGEGEDYCDCWELLDSGLSASGDLWEINGSVDQDGDWTWDGQENVRDHKGNSYTKIQLIRHYF